ncbi:hypothetical protein MKEN_00965800 [Mycena kentingensis (nom. inval.)]|nr:hypothetical protein MKEN_00965800 [Mycena kentingensis (nom. inval.)]
MHMQMPAPTLPPELIDLIVNSVDTNDRATLKACSLAAFAFRRPAQKRLHAHISVACGPSTHTTTTFSELLDRLQTHPHLAMYADTLTVKLTSATDIPTHQTAAASAFSLLANVRRLHISSSDPRWAFGGHIGWRDIVDLGLADWIATLGARGMLEFLSLRGVTEVPPSALSLLATAQHLEVCLVNITLEDEFDAGAGTLEMLDQTPSKTTTQLQELSTVCSPSLIRTLLRPEFTSRTKNIHTLRLRWPETPGMYLSQAANATGAHDAVHSLPALQNIFYTVPLAAQDFSKRPRPRLPDPNIKTNKHILDFLIQALANTPILRSVPLTLVFECPGQTIFGAEALFDFEFDAEAFGKLDESLAPHPTLREVRCVALRQRSELRVVEEQWAHQPALFEAFEQALPRAKARGLLCAA